MWQQAVNISLTIKNNITGNLENQSLFELLKRYKNNGKNFEDKYEI